ncbi:MAG TPA: class II fructose-bisphosphate aldolase [Candidatus Paceibacterota bacterium]|nr:class II fructose-bisphosphate aldolase [Candidatus Paceibacterota bacterium]
MKIPPKSLREYVTDALSRKVAIGHFNISNLEGFWAVIRAAKELSLAAGRDIPVIIGVSEGERSFMGVEQVRALVNTAVASGQPVFLNADHTYSFDKVAEVIDAGYDSVIYDGTEQSFDDNVAATKKCAEYLRAAAKKSKKDLVIEAELGFIGKSSKVLAEIPAGVKITDEFLTKPEEAKRFVELTGVDMLAPAVGNIHGMLSGGKDPDLNIARIKEIADAVKIPLVLHGGSGNSAEDFVAAIDAGVAIIHVNTEIRVAFRKALKKELEENTDEVAPYKIMKAPLQAMQAVVLEKLKIFNRI